MSERINHNVEASESGELRNSLDHSVGRIATILDSDVIILGSDVTIGDLLLGRVVFDPKTSIYEQSGAQIDAEELFAQYQLRTERSWESSNV